MAENVNDTVRTIQRFIGASPDGEWGNQTNARFTEALRVIQAQLGIKSDGWAGNQTVVALEKAMREGKLNKDFGNAVIALFEGRAEDRHGHPELLNSLQSRHGDNNMHDAPLIHDPKTGDYRVQGGASAFDLKALMPDYIASKKLETPAIHTSVAPVPAFAAAATPPEQPHDPPPLQVSAAALSQVRPMPEFPHEPAPALATILPTPVQPVSLPRPPGTVPEKTVPNMMMDANPSPTTTAPAFATASVPGPAPSGSPFGFGKDSMGATIENAAYQGNEAAMVAKGLHSDGAAMGPLTLTDAVLWQRTYASTDASPDESGDKIDAYCKKYGIDEGQIFDTQKPGQLQALMGRLSGYVNGVPPQSLPPAWTNQFSQEAYSATGQAPAPAVVPPASRPAAAPGMAR
jgi:hypothetical protein